MHATNVRQLASRVEPVPGVAFGPPFSSEAGSPASGLLFADALRRAIGGSDQPEVILSSHAQERLAQRGISLSDAQRAQLGEALRQLEDKGARDALVLREDAAFIMNVPNRTLVTAMTRDELQDRVFTQIDSALLL